MVRVVTGPFHPTLESALVEEIDQLKRDDPFAPLAIVVPSNLLRRRLHSLLCVERQRTLLDIQVLTFHQLALRLYEEQHAFRSAHNPGPSLELVQDLFFEHLLTQIAVQDLPGLNHLHPSSLSPGYWRSLWATLRDLKEAMVDPSVALRGVMEGLFEPDVAKKLQGVFTFYEAMLESSRNLGVASADDLAVEIIPWAADASFFVRLRHICYYGFYDLSQVQLSLFETVAECIPVTVFFPLTDDPAFMFARRFFERHLYVYAPSPPEGTHSANSHSTESTVLPERPLTKILNAAGPEDELILVCKEILLLVEREGYRFDEIGVVSRTLDPYQAALRRVFDQHRIPFTSTAVRSLIQEPGAKVVFQLAELPVSGFYWRKVLNVLTSPFYRKDHHTLEGAEPQCDLWPILVRNLGITRGVEEWMKLQSVIQASDPIGESTELGIKNTGQISLERGQLQLLWHLVSQLIEDCQALPSHGEIGELTDAFANLVSRYLIVPGLTSGSLETPEQPDTLESLGSGIQNILGQFRQLARIEKSISWEQWTRMFLRAMESASMPIVPDNHHGIRVLDAMSARGLPFKALFLLGMNEKVFPRFIREDAFLRDRDRRVLDATLGYKIDEKLAGYDEEALLFSLLKQAARSRLYLLYQRADRDGRALASSPFLGEFLQSSPAEGQETEVSLPRRSSDRIKLPLFLPSLLTPEELSVRLVLQGQDPSKLLEGTQCKAPLFLNGRKALRHLEGSSHRLGTYDGLLNDVGQYWEQLTTRGLSPTPLEVYARCPFQYFARQVLRLQSARPPVGKELPAHAFGELCHRVLRAGYQQLVQLGWPQQDHPHSSFRELMRSSAEKVFTAYAVSHGTGYVLTWELSKNSIMELVIATMDWDEKEFREMGFRPLFFEIEAEGSLEGMNPPFSSPLKLRGCLDRVDQRTTPPELRIVDYKFQQGQKMKGQDRDLLTSGIRGFRLQPPLYALMTAFGNVGPPQKAPQQGFQVGSVELLFLAPRWEQTINCSTFNSSAWQTPSGRQLKKTFQTLLEGIHAGRYFILPGTYCDHCDVSVACRRFHGPTWWRAHRYAPTKQLRQLRTQRMNSD